jgi:hypothetical protein
MKLGLTLLLVAFFLVGDGDSKDRAQVQQALDRPVELDVTDVPLADALARISAASRVTISISPQTLALLPYGDRTKVSARLHNVSLRAGLTELTSGIGLRFEVRDKGIEVVPSDPLMRLGTTSSWETLTLLSELKSTDFAANQSSLERWQSRMQFRVPAPEPWPRLQAAMKAAGAGPGDEILTTACEALGWTWYPDKQHIVVLEQEEQLRRQLDKTVSLRESHSKIVDVMQKVGRQAGVPVRTEPGVIAALLPQIRSDFRLHVENVSAAYAFELIASAAGLGYRVDKEGVVFYQPSASPQLSNLTDAGQPSSRSPFVAKMILPADENGVVIEIVIRESDLSPDVNELRKKLVKQADEAIRKALQAITEPEEG